MNHRELVAHEGWPFIALFAVVAVLLYIFTGTVGAIAGLVLTGFGIFFFRNPHREIVQQRGIVVAPADGRVMDITTVTEDNYIHDRAIRIRIFLSIFNVHINRIPIAGKVEWIQKEPGLFLPAYKDEAGDKNVRNYVGIITEWGKILVVQITGLVARRLVCWIQPGDVLSTGQRFGLIRFGSCTEVYLPEEVSVLIKPGQKVKGGETLIARFFEQEQR